MGDILISKQDTANFKIVWITLGVTFALSVAVLGMILFRKRQKKNKRYTIKLFCYSYLYCALIVSNFTQILFHILFRFAWTVVTTSVQ